MAAALVINTELQPGAYRAKGFQPFQRLVRCTCSLSRSNGLAARFACVTGLKAGVNHIDEFECCSVSGKLHSKAEHKSLAAADVSQRFLIRRVKELIA